MTKWVLHRRDALSQPGDPVIVTLSSAESYARSDAHRTAKDPKLNFCYDDLVYWLRDDDKSFLDYLAGKISVINLRHTELWGQLVLFGPLSADCLRVVRHTRRPPSPCFSQNSAENVSLQIITRLFLLRNMYGCLMFLCVTCFVTWERKELTRSTDLH